MNPKNLHHAYLLVGDDEKILPLLESFFIEKLLFPIQGNPDYWKESFESLGIDESRKVIEMQRGKPLAHNKRIFVLHAQSITREAQNALLKVLEEPTSGSHFFLVVPSESILLPTVKSRMLSVKLLHKTFEDKTLHNSAEIEAFINGDLKERMKITATLSESKDRKKISIFLNEIERSFSGKIMDAEVRNFLTALQNIKIYENDRGASLKMLLDHIALTIPKL